MKIDLNNYEEWMLDYLDGNLNDQQSKEIEAFLLKHPPIADELEGLADAQLQKIETDSLDASTKNQLLFSETENINADNYESVFAASFENDLKESEQLELQAFLSENTFLRNDFESFQSLKLQADLSIHFPQKDTLYKRDKKIVPIWLWSSLAAAVLIIGFWVFAPDNHERMIYVPEQITPRSAPFLEMAQTQIRFPERAMKTVSIPLTEDHFIERAEPLRVISSLNIQRLNTDDKSWQIQMELMQSYAFERNQLNSQVDWAALPSENSRKAFQIISSFLWKTTKAQVQSIGEEVFTEDIQAFNSRNIENITGGFISVKRPVREKE